VSRTVLVARLDNAGDVLLQGPLVRAIAAGADRVLFLAGPRGADAARLLPGVDDVLTWHCPWIDASPDPVDPADVAALADRVRALGVDEAVVSTSFHQSPLPLALVLRTAGVRRISAISVDYPGSLLDVRHAVDDDMPEPERALSLARAAGFDLPAGDDGRLAVRRPLAPVDRAGLHRAAGGPGRGYVVLHPGASVPARAWPAERCAEAVEALSDAGWRVLVTGGPGERALTAAVAGRRGVDLGGDTSLAEMAALVLLGDQTAPCRDTRARECPVPGHPCLTSVSPADVVGAVEKLVSA
jgi:ADP-heptose:LPS heptosyltransferase